MKTIFYNAHLLDSERDIENGTLVIEDGKIVAIYEETITLPEGKAINANGCYVVPALLDTHTHGIGGHDFNLCSLQDMEKVEECEQLEGVGGYFASIVVENHEATCAILKRLKDCQQPGFLGFHLEGPYLNKKQKAVMKEEYLRDPNMDEFQQYCEMAKIRSMTIAPELDKALDLIKEGCKRKVVMNIGHSEASVQEVSKAQKTGAKGVTHLYNAMTQHAHRNPGVVTGAILSNLMCELIVDGFHIHPDIIKATYQILGSERIVLISDANPCKGLPDGEYVFSGKKIMIEDGKAVVIETGRIAGSTLSMRDACCNMMQYTGCSLQDVIRMASYNPAKLYNCKKGSLQVGYDGDVLVIDKDFHILHSFLHEIWK